MVEKCIYLLPAVLLFIYMSIVSASRNFQLQTAPQKRSRLNQNIWFTLDNMEERTNYSNHINFGYGHQYDLAVAVTFLVLSVFGKFLILHFNQISIA